MSYEANRWRVPLRVAAAAVLLALSLEPLRAEEFPEAVRSVANEFRDAMVKDDPDAMWAPLAVVFDDTIHQKALDLCSRLQHSAPDAWSEETKHDFAALGIATDGSAPPSEREIARRILAVWMKRWNSAEVPTWGNDTWNGQGPSYLVPLDLPGGIVVVVHVGNDGKGFRVDGVFPAGSTPMETVTGTLSCARKYLDAVAASDEVAIRSMISKDLEDAIIQTARSYRESASADLRPKLGKDEFDTWIKILKDHSRGAEVCLAGLSVHGDHISVAVHCRYGPREDLTIALEGGDRRILDDAATLQYRDEADARAALLALCSAQEAAEKEPPDAEGHGGALPDDVAGLHFVAHRPEVPIEMAQADRVALPSYSHERAVPYHGYWLKALPRGGDAHAFCAWPARHGVGGRGTFIVDGQRVVYRQDLGPTAAEAARWPEDPIKEGWSVSPNR